MSIIHTLNSPNEYRFKEKGSLFIGLAYPVASEEETAEILNSVRKKHYDATHHCYSYKLTDGKFRYSDDGEPNGTAGLRIYNAIEHFELTGVLVIVIRFFGGVKLGVGPLGKAYYDSALNVLQSSEIIHKKGYRKFAVFTDFNFMSHVYRVLSHYDVKNINTDYSDEVLISCFAEESSVEKLSGELVEVSNGKIKTESESLITYLQ